MSTQISGATGIDLVQNNALLFTQKQNWIINGQFDVWQRGTSQTAVSGYGSDDRWLNAFIGSSRTHSRQEFTFGQTDVPNNPAFYSRTAITSLSGAGNFAIKYYHMEDVTKLAGKLVSLSFWAKADSNKKIAIDFGQSFGTGGSPFVSAIGVQQFNLTTSWQRFTKTVNIPSVSGKTIGAGNYLELVFWFDAGSDWNARTDSLGNQSGTFDIANVCLVEGSIAQECPNEPYAEVEQKCLRYCEYAGGIAYQRYGMGTAGSTTTAEIVCNFKVKKRVPPTQITYSNIALADAVGQFAVTNLVQSVVSTDTSLLTATVASGLVQYRPYELMTNSSAGKIIFESEL